LIQRGKILAVDTPAKIISGFSGILFSVKAPEKYRLINALRQFPATITAYPFGDSVHVTFNDNRLDPGLYDHLIRNGVTNATVTETEAGIEDRFLELMSKSE
jgi:hypothetical protein